MAKRIDFKFVKAESDFFKVLEHYEIKLKGSGVARTIPCPFHAEQTPSCKVNLGRKIFHCFGCDAKGNILDFVRRMESLPENDLRGAARKVASICGIPTVPPAGWAAESPALPQNLPQDERNGSETVKVHPVSDRSLLSLLRAQEAMLRTRE